jgi:hypothetical protein
MTREANNNPVPGAVLRHFLAFTGWRERRYERRAAWAQLNPNLRTVCLPVAAV